VNDQPAEKDKSVVSVIVTFYSGSSYDSLFRSVPQLAPEGRVPVYQLSPSGIPYALAKLKGEEYNGSLPSGSEQFVKAVDELCQDRLSIA
jgi:hypothetical protein